MDVNEISVRHTLGAWAWGMGMVNDTYEFPNVTPWAGSKLLRSHLAE
jgi:hypothetical protein